MLVVFNLCYLLGNLTSTVSILGMRHIFVG